MKWRSLVAVPISLLTGITARTWGSDLVGSYVQVLLYTSAEPLGG